MLLLASVVFAALSVVPSPSPTITPAVTSTATPQASPTRAAAPLATSTPSAPASPTPGGKDDGGPASGWPSLQAILQWWGARDRHFWLRFLAGALPLILGILHFEFLARHTLLMQGESFAKYAEYGEWHPEAASGGSLGLRVAERVADARAYLWFGALLQTSIFWVLLLAAHLGSVSRDVDLTTFGALIYTLSQMIYRIASGALFGRFFFISALRCAVAVVLVSALISSGGSRTLFSDASQSLVAFLIGLFPLSALQVVARKAESVFHPSEPGEEPVSVGFVEGIDGAVQDRLAEMGITEIQHLATTDPFELALLTFSPVDRTLDWVDQAILIQSVKRKITAFREAGIRSAVELKVIYHRLGDGSAAESVKALFSQLAKRCEMSDEAMLQLARNISEDRIVTSLWKAWQL